MSGFDLQLVSGNAVSEETTNFALSGLGMSETLLVRLWQVTSLWCV